MSSHRRVLENAHDKLTDAHGLMVMSRVGLHDVDPVAGQMVQRAIDANMRAAIYLSELLDGGTPLNPKCIDGHLVTSSGKCVHCDEQIEDADKGGETYDHDARPDDDPEPGDRCKDCGEPVIWMGPGMYDWMHVNDERNR